MTRAALLLLAACGSSDPSPDSDVRADSSPPLDSDLADSAAVPDATDASADSAPSVDAGADVAIVDARADSTPDASPDVTPPPDASPDSAPDSAPDAPVICHVFDGPNWIGCWPTMQAWSVSWNDGRSAGSCSLDQANVQRAVCPPGTTCLVCTDPLHCTTYGTCQ